MKAIKWLKTCYPGMDFGATYLVEKEWNGFLFICDEFGRITPLHKHYLGVLFAEVNHA